MGKGWSIPQGKRFHPSIGTTKSKEPKNPNNSTSRTIQSSKIKDWSYVPVVRSYIELRTGEVMHPDKYLPDKNLEYLLAENIDIEIN